MNTKFEVFAELFIEFFEILSIFADFLEEFNALLSNIFLDDLQDLVVLQVLSRNI